MLQVTEKEIKKRIRFDNPWWEGGGVLQQFREWPRRVYFPAFMRLFQETTARRAVVLMGPRRVGKTVMLTQAVQKLIDDGVPPERVFYVSVDTPVYTGAPLERLLRWFMEIHGHGRDERLYVIFDEIQYHADWERHLKSLVDSFPSIRFCASGSAAAALKMKSIESGAGRFTDFLLPPLTFLEFLRFREIEDALIRGPGDYDIDGLNDAFVDYINWGGFPETVLDREVREAMDRFIAEDIVDKVLLRDLPSLYGIADTQELKRFFTTIAYNTGMEVSYSGLSKASGIAVNTIKKYLYYLEAAFLIFPLYRADQHGKRFKRVTHFKVYLTNPSMRAALFGPIDPDNKGMGAIAETAYIAHLASTSVRRNIVYARWKSGEVDLLNFSRSPDGIIQAVEIKWSDRMRTHPSSELRPLIDFCKVNKNTRPRVLSRTWSGTINIDSMTIPVSPISFDLHSFLGRAAEALLEAGLDPLWLSPLSPKAPLLHE